MSKIKMAVKKLAVAKQTNAYKKELKSKNKDYNSWIRVLETSSEDEKIIFNQNEKCLTNEFEKRLDEGYENKNDEKLAESHKLCKLIQANIEIGDKNCHIQYLVCPSICMPQVIKVLKEGIIAIDAVILTNYDGELSKNSIKKFSIEFEYNKNLIMIYSDEDVMDEDGYRHDPWFKPDWAPDEFTSFPYFGGFVAINADAVKNIAYTSTDNTYSYLYKVLLLNGTFDKHRDENGNLCAVKVKHIPEVLFHSYKNEYDLLKNQKLDLEIKELIQEAMISIIIPSKDHPDILIRCIDSLIERTKLPSNIKYEIIVVDNGSNEKNRTLIDEILLRYKAKYIYEKREFNFSYMCNLGAKAAKGDYLLFLNDDMEIIQEDWLNKLLDKASLPYAGAVGAKLLYPNSSMIQHAGITNLRIGPAHKLQFLDDTKDHYYGRNRLCHDMLAVTGACLMVKRKVFEEAGGFDENLAVAFNDVDLCYKIYEKGYYNIERCDVILYHHESLSRGNDSESAEKQIRLNAEKDYLYEKHEALYGIDPFYNENLTTDMWEYEYAPKYHYEVDLSQEWAKIKDITSVIKAAKEDKCVRIGMECAMDIFKWKYGVPKERSSTTPSEDDLGWYFQGYTFVIGANNACFERLLFLENTETGQDFGVNVNVEYRPDIAANVPDQLNVDLAGYTAKLRVGDLPKGHYQFGMYMKDKTSSLRLYNMSNWEIDIDW